MKTKIKWSRVLDIIHPGTIIRLWTVDGVNWDGGKFESFWFKRNALKKAEEFRSYYLFVDLTNELTGERMRLKDNPDKIKPPTRRFE